MSDIVDRSQESCLALLDRVIGLEQQFIEFRRTRKLTASEKIMMQDAIEVLRSSQAFRVGQLVMSPPRLVRFVIRRARRIMR